MIAPTAASSSGSEAGAPGEHQQHHCRSAEGCRVGLVPLTCAHCGLGSRRWPDRLGRRAPAPPSHLKARSHRPARSENPATSLARMVHGTRTEVVRGVPFGPTTRLSQIGDRGARGACRRGFRARLRSHLPRHIGQRTTFTVVFARGRSLSGLRRISRTSSVSSVRSNVRLTRPDDRNGVAEAQGGARERWSSLQGSCWAHPVTQTSSWYSMQRTSPRSGRGTPRRWK